MSEVINLFPIPLYVSDEYKLSDVEKDYIMTYENNITENAGGNGTSYNHYVLEESKLNLLKEFIIQQVNIYWHQIYNFNKSSSLRLTQSWINFNSTKQFHHKHQHSNSVISGVFYIQGETPITFDRPSGKPLNPFVFKINKYNQYNNEEIYVNAFPNKLFLFPSQLLHSVGSNENKEKRISLACNFFPV